MKHAWKMWLCLVVATTCNAAQPALASGYPWEGSWIEAEEDCSEQKDRVFKYTTETAEGAEWSCDIKSVKKLTSRAE